LMLTIRDNGRGFDADYTQRGLGLLGIRERTASIGAQLEFESRVGMGSVVRVGLASMVFSFHVLAD